MIGSVSIYNVGARESSYTPPCKTTFSSPGRVHRNSGRVCKNKGLFMTLSFAMAGVTPLSAEICFLEKPYNISALVHPCKK